MTPIPSPDGAPRLYSGGISVDDRGSLSFVNDFDFAGIKRFYLVATIGGASSAPGMPIAARRSTSPSPAEPRSSER